MVRRTGYPFVVLLTIVALFHAEAAGPVIGLAVASGKLQVDRATVVGNGNLTEGSSVISAEVPARIELNTGKRGALGPSSEAQVFSSHILLMKGSALSASETFQLQAQGFEIAPAASAAQAAVTLQNAGVRVIAVDGPVKVRGANGIMVARLNPGTGMLLGTASSTGSSTMTGVVRQETGRLMLKDNVTNLDVELRGPLAAREVGRYVEVTGKASASSDGESQVIEVSLVRPATTNGEVLEEQQGTGTSRPVGGQTGASKPTPTQKESKQPGTKPAKTRAGMSAGAKVALFAVVGGAAAGIGAWAATKSSSSVSR
jgi:hypothetical protein